MTGPVRLRMTQTTLLILETLVAAPPDLGHRSAMRPGSLPDRATQFCAGWRKPDGSSANGSKSIRARQDAHDAAFTG
jgi:hypothetical protein